MASAKERLKAWAGGSRKDETETGTQASGTGATARTPQGGTSAKERLKAWAGTPTSSARSQAPSTITTGKTGTARTGASGTGATTAGRQRDDAAVRRSFAARHPELTGGEAGEKTRAINTAWVEAKKALDDAEKAVNETRKGTTPVSAPTTEELLDYLRGKGVSDSHLEVYRQQGDATVQEMARELGYDARKARVSDAEKRRDELESQVKQLDQARRYDSYERLRGEPDFAEKSKADDSIAYARVGRADLGTDQYKYATYAAVNGVSRAQDQMERDSYYTYRDLPEDVVSMFNYLWKTQGETAAKEYLDLAADQAYTPAGSALAGLYTGSGLRGATDILSGGGLADVNKTIAEDAQKSHPLAYGVADAGATIGAMLLGSKALGTAGVASPALSSAITMGTNTAVKNASNVFTDDMTPGEYALSVAGSAAGGAVGGKVTQGVAGLGTKALFKTGLQNNIFANAINQGLGGAAGTAANLGTRAVIDPTYNPSAGELAQDAAVTFAFQTITSAVRLYGQTSEAKAALEREAALLKQDFEQLSQFQKAGITTPTDTIDLLKARSAMLRNTLNKTQYVGQNDTVKDALAFLDQLDDAVAAAEQGLYGTMLNEGTQALGGSGTTPPTGGPQAPAPSSASAPGADLANVAGTALAETGEKAAGTGETGLIPISAEERKQLSTGNRNMVADTVKDIISFTKAALAKKGGQERLYMGVIPDSTARMVLKQTGLDVGGYKAVLTGDGVQHSFNHHGDPATEAARGQRAINIEDFSAIPEILSTPDSVQLVDGTDSSGRRVLWFRKQMGDVYVTAQAVTDGRHTLTTDSIWVQKKRSHQDTTPDASVSTDPVPNARSAPPKGSSVSSIPQSGGDVNLEEDAGVTERERELERRIAELDAQKVARDVADLGTQGQATIKAMFVDGQDAETYVRGMKELYIAGRSGVAMDRAMTTDAAASLTDSQRRAAYTAGQVDDNLPFYFGSEEGKKSEQTGGVRVREGGQRPDGAGTQGAAGPVAGGTVADIPGADRRGPADAGAGTLQTGREVSSFDLGIPDGVKTDRVRLVTGGDTQITQAAKEEAAGRGLELVLFAGDDLHIKSLDQAGQTVTVETRGYIAGQKMYVRADHGEFNAQQLVRHEIYHDMAAAGEVDPRATMETARERLGDKLTDRLETVYGHALGDMAGVELWEEIAADQYGGMNIFAGTPFEGDIEALQVLVGAQTEAQRQNSQTAQATERRTGPPVDSAAPAAYNKGKTSREQSYSGRNVEWAVKSGVLTEEERISFFHMVANVSKLGDKVRRTIDGGYIIDLGHKLLFTDADWYSPSLSSVVVFNDTSETSMKVAKDVIFNGRSGKAGYEQSRQIIEDAYWPGYVERYTERDSASHARQVTGGEGKTRGGDLEGSEGEDVASDRENPDTNFSQEGDQAFIQELRGIQQDVDAGTMTVETARERLDAMIEEYGAIKVGEKPARNILVPKQTAKDRKVYQTVRTILEAEVTPEVAVPTLEELTANGEFSYKAYADREAIRDAESKLKRIGWKNALETWEADAKKGVVSKEHTTMGWLLYNNEVNVYNNTRDEAHLRTSLEILDLMVLNQHNAAQAVQATRILKQLTPETQLYDVRRSVSDLENELNKRYGDKKGPKLQIPEDLAKEYLEAETQDERDKIKFEIGRAIGRQVPSTLADKWTAWRYLAMLCNVRTHVRNVVGNVGFMPVVGAKDLTATAIEAVVDRVSGGRLERTKGVVGLTKSDRTLLKAAWGDYVNVRDQALGEGKYNDRAIMDKGIEAGRRVFQSKYKLLDSLGKPLEAVRRGNGTLLDLEDAWFSQPHYAFALAQFCKANGITAEELTAGDPARLAKARAYAVLEAQKATYRDTNAFSQWVSSIGRVGKTDSTLKKAFSVAVEGVLPFRKTPANILVRGVEYSPIGLLKSLTVDLAQVAKGTKTGAEAIDHISAGLTGTGLMMLGVFLAAQGLVRGGGNDDKKKEFEELQGHQDYALEVGGTSVTLDWLAPEALPFFMGVNLYEQTQGDWENMKMEDLLRAAGSVTEPLLEMSCLQSLNDLIEAVQYGDTDGIVSMAASVGTSYLTQALPTLFGQAERASEGERMTTYTDKNKFITTDMQYAIGRVSARIPGFDYGQIPYISAWGEVEDSGSLPERIVNNFLNPAYTSQIDTSAMEDELLRLYEYTGDSGVFPSRVSRYFNVNGERKDLTAKEYVIYATVAGTEAKRLVTELTASREYQKMSDTERAEAVEYAYQLAKKTGQGAVAEVDEDSWMTKAREAKKQYGIDEDTYIALKTLTSGIESLKDSNGETIANSKSLQIMEAVYDVPGLYDKQRQAMFEYLGVGKNVRHYNKAKVKEELNKMRKG